MAVTVVMLMALGFPPIRAAAVALIANTAPVVFGALATPIVTLATVTSGAVDDPRLDTDTLGAMVGRRTPLLAVVVPLVLVAVIDGRRGVRQTWPAAIVAGVVFAIGQFVASNYISVPLTDIVAALLAAAAVVLLLRFWRPVESPDLREPAPPGPGDAEAAAPGLGDAEAAASPAGGGAVGTLERRDSGREVARAYAPYLIIIAIFSIANIGVIKDALAQEPWTVKFPWPGREVLGADGEPLASTTFTLGWLPAAGTLMILAGVLTALVLRIRPGRERCGPTSTPTSSCGTPSSP
ncbi:L-lactate permease [Actinoplanes sp. NPDC049118]|uniref:L-lactate permease n=1 Tax=Actinoplanes sp. NPDC049118 TaxID=3155769 RepID=UPI0033E52D75